MAVTFRFLYIDISHCGDCDAAFLSKISFAWYWLKSRFLLTKLLSPLAWSIFLYLSTVALRFIFIDFSELSTAKTCMNCLRWGWVYCYIRQIVNFRNIKSKLFSFLWSNCHLKVDLYWYMNSSLSITFICISEFGI